MNEPAVKSATQVTTNDQGRLVLPIEARKALGIEGPTTLLIIIEDGQLVLKRREAVVEELRTPYKILREQGVSLADELIAERRERARLENSDN